MRILFLSQYFPPEMGAPAARVFELSREWAALGHDVTVLTGFPNHPNGVIPPEYRGSWVRKELVAGVKVVRAPVYATPNSGKVRRSASYISYAASATLLGPMLVSRPDVVIATSPQLLTGVAGWVLSLLQRVPFVFEVRDIWPQSIVAVGALPQNHPAIWALERLELQLYARAKRIVVVTDSFVDELSARGVPREKLKVIKNGVDLELFKPSARENAVRSELGLRPSDFMCLYVGTHGMAHGLSTMIEAADRVRERQDIRFVFVGEGADKPALKKLAAEKQLRNVTFVDKQSRERIPEFLAASDLNLVLLRDTPLFRTVLPSKIFEIMGSGRPIALGVDGEARELLAAAGAGVFVPPEDAGRLAEEIVRLAGQRGDLVRMGMSGRAF
ncbi:MAG: glycosyltransferase family 4 protein, partial [Gemmatimonadota bacterium]|nr:glycosyltransferase family 4 protein [Gemmatimonadota bacterium]